MYRSLFLIGYYTRSGYVPGPICKYNWAKAWDIAHARNKLLIPKVISSFSAGVYNNDEGFSPKP